MNRTRRPESTAVYVVSLAPEERWTFSNEATARAFAEAKRAEGYDARLQRCEDLA